MRANRATSQTESQELVEVEKITREIIERRQAGLEVDYSAIERQHPSLMPQLGERLRRLRAIEAAATQARQQLRSTGSTERSDVASDGDMEFLRGALGGYEILERIRYGGQGVVYKARQPSTKRVVAIKLLLDGPLASETQRHRFAREAELVSRLRHPNIVTLYESGVVQGRQFFAMEFVDGLPIDDYVLLHGLSVRESVRIFATVCRAISAAHQLGVIHRDLKPPNILVDSEGEPHILDFGLAKDVTGPDTADDASSLSIAGQIVGTLPYLSPEQACGAGNQADVRSDIYTLGIVLFEVITGGFPYQVDGDRQAVLNNILSQEPMTPRMALSRSQSNTPSSAGGINSDLDKIILKALEKDKTRRYQSAAAFADDLGRYLVGDAVEAKAASRFYLLQKTIRKFRVHVAISAAFLALLVAALTGMTVLWQRAERVTRIAQAGLQVGSILKLGSVHRDAGRLDQAAAMFEKAIEIGKYASTSDPFVLRHLYDAHHRLAELYFETDRPDEAAPHCEGAVKLAEDLVRDDPHNVEWRRLLAFSYGLRGRMAFSRNEWNLALQQFDRAATIYQDLISRDPDTLETRRDLAFVQGFQGRCCRMLKRFDEALQHYTAVYKVRKALLELEPHVTDHVIDLALSLNKLAAWHLSQQTEENDQAAGDFLEQAQNLLAELRDSGQAGDREWSVNKASDAIEANKKLICVRAERRSKSSGQCGS